MYRISITLLGDLCSYSPPHSTLSLVFFFLFKKVIYNMLLLFFLNRRKMKFWSWCGDAQLSAKCKYSIARHVQYSSFDQDGGCLVKCEQKAQVLRVIFQSQHHSVSNAATGCGFWYMYTFLSESCRASFSLSLIHTSAHTPTAFCCGNNGSPLLVSAPCFCLS